MKMKEKITKDEFINQMKESIVPAMFDIAGDADTGLSTRLAFCAIANVIKTMLNQIVEEKAA